MVYVELVCMKCQESRYRTKMPVVPETTKMTPELFIPLGDQLPAENYTDGPKCYVCESPLRPMPVNAGEKPSREAGVSRTPATPMESAPIQSLFECGPDENDLQVQTLGSRKLLVKTSKRIVIINLEEAIDE